jgi:RNA polymerase sigma-70 factor (ECF subfamily)
MNDVEDSAAGGDAATEEGPPSPIAGAAPPWRPPGSRVDRAAEDAAIERLRSGRRDEALRALMVAYGGPITAFSLRIVRDRELARDVRQQVFLSAFQRIDTFEGRSSLWSWLCGIAYHRCLDELKRNRRVGAVALDDFDVLDGLVEPSEATMGPDRIARRRALERCLGKLPVALRTQLLMRCYLGLSHAEIGEVVGEAPGTVQVRISRILPRLRRCLHGEGIER